MHHNNCKIITLKRLDHYYYFIPISPFFSFKGTKTEGSHLKTYFEKWKCKLVIFALKINYFLFLQLGCRQVVCASSHIMEVFVLCNNSIKIKFWLFYPNLDFNKILPNNNIFLEILLRIAKMLIYSNLLRIHNTYHIARQPSKISLETFHVIRIL